MGSGTGRSRPRVARPGVSTRLPDAVPLGVLRRLMWVCTDAPIAMIAMLPAGVMALSTEVHRPFRKLAVRRGLVVGGAGAGCGGGDRDCRRESGRPSVVAVSTRSATDPRAAGVRARARHAGRDGVRLRSSWKLVGSGRCADKDRCRDRGGCADASRQPDQDWVAAVILQLVAEGRLRLEDPVERWLPGVLSYGGKITVRELLDHTSGIVDQQTFDQDALRFIERVRDPALRTELLRFWRRLATDPSANLPGAVALRFIATLPLLWKPGSQFHYSNIGYEIAGLIAAKAAGAPLRRLLEQRISRPLGLTSAAYVPGGEVEAPHPQDYTVAPNGTVRDATDFDRVDEGASGAMIASARDDARFLTSLMQGKLLPPAQHSMMTTPSAANPDYGLGIGITTDCYISAYDHGGASYSTTSAALVSRRHASGRRPAQRQYLRGSLARHTLEQRRSQRCATAVLCRLTAGRGSRGAARDHTEVTDPTIPSDMVNARNLAASEIGTLERSTTRPAPSPRKATLLSPYASSGHPRR